MMTDRKIIDSIVTWIVFRSVFLIEIILGRSYDRLFWTDEFIKGREDLIMISNVSSFCRRALKGSWIVHLLVVPTIFSLRLILFELHHETCGLTVMTGVLLWWDNVFLWSVFCWRILRAIQCSSHWFPSLGNQSRWACLYHHFTILF